MTLPRTLYAEVNPRSDEFSALQKGEKKAHYLLHIEQERQETRIEGRSCHLEKKTEGPMRVQETQTRGEGSEKETEKMQVVVGRGIREADDEAIFRGRAAKGGSRKEEKVRKER